MVKPSRSKDSRGNLRTSKPAASVSGTKRHDPGRSRSRNTSQNRIMDDNDAADERKIIRDLVAFERHTHPTEDDTVVILFISLNV